jgi:hypothetical protein
VATVHICDLVQYRRAGKDSRFALFADEKPKNWQEPQRVPTDMLLPIGVFVLLYAAYALVQGEVWAKDRWSGKRVYRDQSPFYFWFMIAVYTALGVLLIAGC